MAQGEHGISIGVVVAPANRHDSPLLEPTLDRLSRFGFDLPERITVHLDASYDSRKTRELLELPGCDARIPRGRTLAGRSVPGDRAHRLMAHPRVRQAPGLR